MAFKVPTLVKDGRFLGRTPASWAKILTFYLVYYSFLACLIYFSVTIYSSNLPRQPGGNQPKIVTRTDSPGAAVYPFQTVDATVDGDGNLNLSDEKHRKAYTESLSKFTEDAKKANDGANDCSNTDVDITRNACLINNVNTLSGIDFEQSAKDYEPYFIVNLNKLLKWTPINVKSKVQGGKFVKDSVQFDCFHFSKLDGRVTDSKFDIALLPGTEQQLGPQYFPYHAFDKKPENSGKVSYNKPFVIGQIKAKSGVDAAELWNEQHYFRCNILADNLLQPLTGAEFNDNKDSQGWSTDLTKLGLGFVEFGYSYGDSTE